MAPVTRKHVTGLSVFVGGPWVLCFSGIGAQWKELRTWCCLSSDAKDAIWALLLECLNCRDPDSKLRASGSGSSSPVCTRGSQLSVWWKAKVTRSYLTLCDPMDCSSPGSSVLGIFQQEYWSGLPFPSSGSFPTQGSNPGLLHCRWILYHLSQQGSPCDEGEGNHEICINK